MITHRKIFDVAWPYTLSMSTSFIIQAVDSTMVAPLGATSLAALAITGTSAFLPNAVAMGLITSVQKRVAMATDARTTYKALSAGLLLGALISIPFTILYMTFSNEIAGLFAQGHTAELAASFLRIMAPSFLFMSMNQALNGFWIGALKSRTRLAVTLCVMVVNVLGNLILIPHLGFSGVALASATAIFCSFVLNLVLTRKLMGYQWVLPRTEEMISDLKTIAGVSLNQVSLAFSLNAAVFVIGKIGINALAIANVIGTLSLPALYLGIGYGTATGSYLARFLSQKDRTGARHVGRIGLTQVFLVSGFFSLILLFFGSPIRHWFFVDKDLYELSRVPFLLLALLYVVDGLCCTLQRYHFLTDGIAFSIVTMSIVQWLFFIPVAWAGVQFFGMNYSTYFQLHIFQRILVTAILYVAWTWRIAKAEPLHAKDL